MKIYITEMLRWGEEETHHYIIGAYSTDVQAEFAGEVEKTWRGGKYDYRVIEVVLDQPTDDDKWKYHMQCVVPESMKKEKAA